MQAFDANLWSLAFFACPLEDRIIFLWEEEDGWDKGGETVVLGADSDGGSGCDWCTVGANGESGGRGGMVLSTDT